MKIITMDRETVDGKRVQVDPDHPFEHRDWWCVIETPEEELFYDKYVCGNKGLAGETNAEHIWNEMVKHAGRNMGVKWGDDDMYGYILPNEVEPEVGEEYKDADGDIWVRIQ